MHDATSSAGDVDRGDDELTQSIRERLQREEAGERQTQALLESVASLMGVSDQGEVMRGIARSAAMHLGLPGVRVYRVDHDAGVLVEAARVEVDKRDGATFPPGAPVQVLEVDDCPIAMRPGDHLAEFALGSRTELVVEDGSSDGTADGTTLIQMRTVRSSDSGAPGVLVGVIAASWIERPTEREIDLLRTLASIGAAAAEAARIEEFRSQLVSAVSHELRTPLAAIRAYNELLLDEDAGEINEEQRLFLQRIETTCLHLDRMVEDLLDLSRLRAGEMVIRRLPVDVVSVIEHIMDTLSPEAAKRNISLSDEIVGTLPMISSDPDRMAQVLFNLVGNAVKYVDENGSVLVRVAMANAETCRGQRRVDRGGRVVCAGGDGQCLLIEVIDDGPGIAKNELDRVFDEFYRGRLTERSTRGSGLGLAIASRLTRLLGGVLEVDSTPGSGSTFSLMFPFEPPEEADIS